MGRGVHLAVLLFGLARVGRGFSVVRCGGTHQMFQRRTLWWHAPNVLAARAVAARAVASGPSVASHGAGMAARAVAARAVASGPKVASHGAGMAARAVAARAVASGPTDFQRRTLWRHAPMNQRRTLWRHAPWPLAQRFSALRGRARFARLRGQRANPETVGIRPGRL